MTLKKVTKANDGKLGYCPLVSGSPIYNVSETGFFK